MECTIEIDHKLMNIRMKGGKYDVEKMLILITACLLLVCGCAVAEGKVYEVRTVAELEKWLANAEDGATIRLMNDLTITVPFGETEKEDQMYVYTKLTLDMNGKTLRDERIGSPRVINVQKSGGLTIIGDGRFENMDHNSDFFQALGPIFVYSGHFSHDPFEWFNPECKYINADEIKYNEYHWNNYRKLGYLFGSYIGNTKEYEGYVTVYNATFDSGIKNPEKVYEHHNLEKYPFRVCYYMYPMLNEGNDYAHGITTYGGTYVTANPADGEGNWCDKNQIKDPFYLNGQTKLGVAPSPYTIEESVGADNRKVYKLNYPVTLTAQKRLINLTDDKKGLAGYTFELKNTASGKITTAVSNEKGEIVFDLPLEDAEDTYTLREIPGKDPLMDYCDLVYEVKIVPGPRAERYKPVAQVSLNGKVVESAVFRNMYGVLPETGDSQNLMLYAMLAMGSVMMLVVLRRRSVRS